MKLEVHISKKYFFILLGSILILMGMLGVLAFNSGGPPGNTGHSWEEIESPEQANRWADWDEVTNKPMSATNWTDWEDIENLPPEWADGDDVGNAQVQMKTCSVGGSCNFGFSPEVIFIYISELTGFGINHLLTSGLVLEQGGTVDVCEDSNNLNPALCPIFLGEISLNGDSVNFEENSWFTELKIVAYKG